MKNKINIIQTRTLSGPNYWSLRPCIQMILDIGTLEERPTNKIDGFYKRFKEAFPSIHEHRCSIGKPGGFFQRVKEGTWMGHVVEHVALELQTLAGMDTGFGRTRETSDKGIYHVVFSYIVSEVGQRAGELSVEICEKLISGDKYDLDAIIHELKELRERYKLGPSTYSLVDEAIARDIPFTRLNRGSLVQLGYGTNQKRIRATMTGQTSSLAVDFAGDKWETKELLEKHGIPVPKGVEYKNYDNAFDLAQKWGYPLVVKPSDGNHGRGITVGVDNDELFKDAWKTAKKQSKNGYVIIEKMLKGTDYRLLVINGKLAAAAKRVPAQVTGDGKQSIQELIDEENNNPLRGYGHENILTEITVDHQTKRLIADSGYTLKSVLAKNEILLLKTTANLSTGGTAIDVTDFVHPANIHIAERAIRIVGLDIGGVDIVAPDITTPLSENNGGIVELNAAPGFRMHLQPTKGLPRNVAEPVLDMLFPPGSSSTIPIIAVTGTNGKTTTTRLLNHIMKFVGHTVGMCTTEGVYIKNRLIYEGDMTGPLSHKMVLTDPTVDMAVLECARGGMLRAGLGFRYCDVGVVTNVSADHLGQNYINDLEKMSRVKGIIPEVVKPDGYAILNADDSLVAKMSNQTKGKVIYFSLDYKSNSVIKEHLKSGGMAVIFEEGAFCIMKGKWKYPLIEAKDVPITFDGKARFNIANVLAAIGAAIAMGVKNENINAALTTFFPSYSQTPGRLTMFDMGPYKALVDFAHNVAGYDALAEFVRSLNPKNSIATICLPGDRRDEDFQNVAKTVAETFNQVILFEGYLRGKKVGYISKTLRKYLISYGMDSNKIEIITDEHDAVQYALDLAQEGDLLVISNYDIEGVHNRLIEHKKIMETKKTKKHKPKVLEAV